MKITTDKTNLESVISNAISYAEKKDNSSITSHLFLEAKDGTLKIKATDYEIGIIQKVKNTEILDEGNATTNAKRFAEIIRALKDDKITIETMNNYLYVRQKNSKFKLPMFNSMDFPEFPTKENKSKFDINSKIFTRSIKKISSCVEQNNPNFSLTGALVDIRSDFVNLVGTDTKRLSIFKIEKSSQKEESIIIPKKSIQEIQKIFYEDVEIYFDESTLVAVSENFEFYTKLLNGKFPNYEKAIPTECKVELTIPRDKFLDGMKTIGMVCDKMSVSIKDNTITFEGISDDNSEAKTAIECELNLSEEIKFNIYNKFFLDFLNSIEESTFYMGYNDSNLAVTLKSGDLTTVVMPVII
ncbi:MAG: DNA polymerase III subunit beta [Campylobacter sp.]|nr:DNA polymerase III subunit beta [Campylobacter sp.]